MDVVDCLEYLEGELGTLGLSQGVVAGPNHAEQLASLVGNTVSGSKGVS